MIAKSEREAICTELFCIISRKVEKENGAVLLLNKIPDTIDGRYSTNISINVLSRICLQYQNRKDCTAYIALNQILHPDKVSDEQLRIWLRNIWSVWATAISPISFSNIWTLTARISISFRPAWELTERKSPMITTTHAQWLLSGFGNKI